MVRGFTDNPKKKIVREKWDTPLLRFLHNQFNIKYRYLGLPGVNLYDVLLWKDMIEEVVAFEPPDDSKDNRSSILELRKNLRINDIKGYAHWGSIEEVIIMRKDYEGQEYKQDKLITLYNLDFCDEICSRIHTLEDGKKLWRYHVIRQILSDQKNCYNIENKPNFFILLLTIRNQIDAYTVSRLLKKDLLSSSKEYYDACIKSKSIPPMGPLRGSHGWTLKLFLYNWFQGQLNNPHISALFFPFVLYYGAKTKVKKNQYISSPMMHMMLLCYFSEPEYDTPVFGPESYLNHYSVKINNENEFYWAKETGENNTKIEKPDALNWLEFYGEDVLSILNN